MVHSGPVNRHDYVERPRGSVYCCPLAGESVCDADGRVYIRAAAHSTGEGRMNNLGITVSVIPIAVAQLLTILLTIGRERDIKELRKRVDELHGLLYEQRLQIVELKAWLAGRNAAQLSRLKSKNEPIN